LRDHIKEVGEYDVLIKLHRDVTPTIKVKVVKEGGEEVAAAETAPEAGSSAPVESASVEPESPDAAVDAEAGQSAEESEPEAASE
jgi:hypothetical protein